MYIFDPNELSFVEWFSICFLGVMLIFVFCQGIDAWYQFGLCTR